MQGDSSGSLHTPNTPEILNTIVNITETLGPGHPATLPPPLDPQQIQVTRPAFYRINCQ